MADNFVYKYVLDGEVIYIGKADHGLKRRLNQHGKYGDNIPKEGWGEINKADIFYAEMANSAMSEIYESELIRRYKPKYNKAKTGEWTGISLPEPNWLIYDPAKADAVKKLQAEVDRLTKEVDALKNSNDAYKELIAKHEEEVEEKVAEAHCERDCECAYCEVRSRFESIQKIRLDAAKFTSETREESKTYDEILEEYRSGSEPLNYTCIALNPDGSINCVKKIYTNSYDMLDFLFIQKGTETQHGSILYRRDSETQTNSQITRCWLNRGSNRYFRTFVAEKMMDLKIVKDWIREETE